MEENVVTQAESEAQVPEQQAPEQQAAAEVKPTRDIAPIIKLANDRGASDIHLKTNCPPMARIAGDIVALDAAPLTADDITAFLGKYTETDIPEFMAGNSAKDFSVTVDDLRLRGNAFRDYNGVSVSLRLLTLVNSDFKGLGIPEILKKMSERRSGLILITGPTGSGKTTTLTYLLKYINQTASKHIIMLEDPIEFLHFNDKCIFSQREVGKDTPSYGDAITEAMREDPDIIVVGEMRDQKSIEAALRAAETGHLVLSTLHTKGAVNSVTRIIDVFPSTQQNQIRTQLSMSLLGVVSQQLCPGKEKGKRYLATEVMVVTDPVRAIIKQDKVHMLATTIQTSRNDGMYTMKTSLTQLLNSGKITQQTFDAFQI